MIKAIINITNILLIGMCLIYLTTKCEVEITGNVSYIFICFIIVIISSLLYLIFNSKKEGIIEMCVVLITIILLIISIILIIIIFKVNISNSSEVFYNNFLDLKLIKTDWSREELIIEYKKQATINNLQLNQVELNELLNGVRNPEELKIKVDLKLEFIGSNKNYYDWSFLYDFIIKNQSSVLLLVGGTVGLSALLYGVWSLFMSGLILSSSIDSELKAVSNLQEILKFLTLEVVKNKNEVNEVNEKLKISGILLKEVYNLIIKTDLLIIKGLDINAEDKLEIVKILNIKDFEHQIEKICDLGHILGI